MVEEGVDNMKKKILAVFMVFIIMLFLVPTVVNAKQAVNLEEIVGTWEGEAMKKHTRSFKELGEYVPFSIVIRRDGTGEANLLGVSIPIEFTHGSNFVEGGAYSGGSIGGSLLIDPENRGYYDSYDFDGRVWREDDWIVLEAPVLCEYSTEKFFLDIGLKKEVPLVGHTGGDEKGFPIEVAIGGAAIGAAVVVILKVAKKRKTAPQKAGKVSSSEGEKEGKQDQDQPEGYILNISEDNVSVSPETSAQLIATVLRVFADGSTQRDPSAPITVSLKPNSDLQVIPLKGFGEVSLSISQKSAEPMSIEEYIDITTVVSGGQKTARVKVSAAPAVQVVFF